MRGTVLSINVSMPQTVQYLDKKVLTSINKTPVRTSIQLGLANFAGDAQADLVNHGGPDKAVCVYPYEHYGFWEEVLGKTLHYGAFGENVTTRGISEDAICIGDRFRLGSALVQVSQPRQPCFKLGLKHGVPELAMTVQSTGRTGFYFRVLEEGEAAPGATLERVCGDPRGISVAEANRIKYFDKHDLEGLSKLIALEPLSETWKQSFRKRLAELEDPDSFSP